MPMKYDPDTGIPSYLPDIDLPGAEIEEGVTPKATVIDSKAAVFKGDKRPSKREYDLLRDGPLDATPVDTSAADRLLNEAIRNARPAKLDAHIATDEEIIMLELAAQEQAIANWPIILRLINRLRQAEAR